MLVVASRSLPILAPPVQAGVGDALRRAYAPAPLAATAGEFDALLARLR